jgi:hypothetical protein
MLNRDIYLKDPLQSELLNNGVAKVAEEQTPEERRTLRYELETFVCDGEYEKGLERILSTFLSHLNQTEQPGVWVSGFFGSGKSHLVKMLRALWEDYVFPEDHATARGLAKLPESIRDGLKDLATAGKRAGGLHAASGTLGAGAADYVRPAILSIVFRSLELPSAYPQARFVIWLKKEGYFEAVKTAVERAGRDWSDELNDLYVSRPIVEALLAADPSFAASSQGARAQIREQYPNRDDVSNDDMIAALRAVLTTGGRLPLTLIVLDEVQQYIGEDPDRTYDVQEAIEACSAAFGGKLMFVATGQTALAGTPSLQRLLGRFPLKVELSDTDVDTVIRKIILEKKPESIEAVRRMLTDHQGEISRHLTGTELGYRPEDQQTLVADYPILPVRRRFWEKALRCVDPTGTRSQLRNQLTVVHEATRHTARAELGCVVGADFLFDQNASQMLQAGVLPKETYERIKSLQANGGDDLLKARICALVFLIGKLPRDPGADLGVRATEQVLADLLVEDLRAGSGALRQQLPGLLDSLTDSGLLMRVDSEYRLQTREGAAWNDEYRGQYGKIQNNPPLIAGARVELFRKEVRERLSAVRILQGRSKELRKPELHFGAEPPPDQNQAIWVWVRDGWDTEESAVVADARVAGNQSPTLFVFLRRTRADELKAALAGLHAAEATLNARGLPSTPEGQEARNAMLTLKTDKESSLRRILDDIFAEAAVIQGGGQEIAGTTLATKVEEGMQSSLARLYPKFDLADHESWSKVIERSKGGAGDPLAVVGYTGDTEQHEVCKAILRFVGSGKKGSDVRAELRGRPCGWPQDAIDGGIYALLAGGHLRATDPSGQPVQVKSLPQGQVTKLSFRVESTTVTAAQRIKVRKVLQELGLPAKTGEELAGAEQLIPTLRALAESAGGGPPRPERPPTKDVDDLAALQGNALLVVIAERQEDLVAKAQQWKATAEMLAKRIARWDAALELLQHADDLPETAELATRVEAIHTQRLLLENPDPVPAICDALTQKLRHALQQTHADFAALHARETTALEADPAWKQLAAAQRESVLQSLGLHGMPAIATGTEAEVLASLRTTPFATWRDRTAALPERFSQARLAAAKILEPKATRVTLPSRTLKNTDDARGWLKEVEDLVVDALKNGPVVV